METTSPTFALIEALHPEGAVDDGRRDGRSRSGDRTVAIGSAAPPDLDGNGIAWVAVPPGRRRRMRRELGRQGFVVESSWLPVPRASPRSLLPLGHLPGATRRRLGSRVIRSRLMRAVWLLPGGLLEELAPGVALLAQRPDTEPPLAWLAGIGVGEPVVVSAGWHAPAARLLLVGERTIVKSSRAGDDRDSREASALLELGPSTRRSGARVPTVLYSGPARRRTALVEERLPGARVADLLRRHPSRLDDVAGKVGEWLARWHLETRVTRAFTADDLERFVLEPARAVAQELSHGAEYAERLDALGRSLCGVDVPFAAAHNDLTTWNLLVDGDTLSVVDWEDAAPEALPLVDLDYLLVDAITTAHRTTRPDAFGRSNGDGPEGRLAGRLRAELAARLNLDPPLAELARHACWLGHARNELRRHHAGATRPFLEIVASLAQP